MVSVVDGTGLDQLPVQRPTDFFLVEEEMHMRTLFGEACAPGPSQDGATDLAALASGRFPDLERLSVGHASKLKRKHSAVRILARAPRTPDPVRAVRHGGQWDEGQSTLCHEASCDSLSGAGKLRQEELRPQRSLSHRNARTAYMREYRGIQKRFLERFMRSVGEWRHGDRSGRLYIQCHPR